MTTDTAPAKDTAAAELALGVLDGDERAEALRRVIADPAFAREVEQWRDHFASLFAGISGVEAPSEPFERAERRIASDRGGAAVTPLRRSLNPWKPVAVAASVAALALAGVAFRPEPVIAPPKASSPPIVAAMALTGTTDSQPAYYDAAAQVVKMPGPMPIPQGKSAQLWAIHGDQAPVPLGTFAATEPGTYIAEAKLGAVIPPGTKLAITIEPIGGSPTGKPTGAVIASGLLTQV